MFNDVVSIDVNFWNFKEMEQQREKYVHGSAHRGCGVQDAQCIKNTESDVKHALEDSSARLAWMGWRNTVSSSGVPSCTDQQRPLRPSQTSRNHREPNRQLMLAGTRGQVGNHVRYLRVLGNRTVGAIDVKEEYLQNELTDAKSRLVEHNRHLPRQSVFRSVTEGSRARLGGQCLNKKATFEKQTEYRHKCQIAAIAVDANSKIRKNLIG